MKKTLRNLMLAGTVVLLSYSTNAQSLVLTESWKNTTNIPGEASGGEFRFASAKEGKIIVTDKANKKIMTIDNNGMTELFDLTAAYDTHYGVDKIVVDEETQEESTVRELPIGGTGITVDDAGNILVGTSFAKGASSTDLIIISADLKETYKLKLNLPQGISANRIDQYGKVVGNMLSNEGAYLWLAITANTKVAIIKIANGKQVQEYSQVSNAVKMAMNSSTLVQPAIWNVDEIDALMDNKDFSPTFWSRNRGSSQLVYGWNENGSEQVELKLTENSADGLTTKGAGAEGFATFKMSNISYFVVPMSNDGYSRCGAIGIYDETGKLHATYNPEGVDNGMGQMGSIIVESIDEYSINIYRFIPGVVAYKCNFADISTGINEVEAVDNAKAVYYNLQGVEVENPKNGVFIKVQGSKASKVIVK